MAITERQWVGVIDTKLGKWGPGPWLDEADRVEWRSRAGLLCLVARHPDFGSLLGFVGVPPGHGALDALDDLDVHGGVEHAGKLDSAYGPVEGSEGLVWLQFASGHFLDVVPWLHRIRPGIYEVANAQGSPVGARAAYRDMRYMRAECERLAAQLARGVQ